MSTSSKVVIRNNPWTSQPSAGAPIDWANPLTQGLVDGFLRPIESIKAQPITGSLPTAISSIGACYVSASSSAVITISTPIPQGNALTIMVFARRDGAQPDTGFGITAAFAKLSGASDPFVHFIKDSGERIRFNTTTDDDTANYWETATNWPIGVWQMGAYVFSSGSVPVIYRDGVEQTLSSSAGTIAGTLKASANLQLNYAALRLNGAIGGVLVFNRAKTGQEIKLLSANPWQIFQPQRSYDFSKFSGGQGDTTRKSWFLGSSNPIAAPNSSRYERAVVQPATRPASIPSIPTSLNVVGIKPKYLWSYVGGTGVVDHTLKAPMTVKGTDVSLNPTQHGFGVKGTGAYTTGISGYHGASGAVSLYGIDRMTSAIVVIFHGWESTIDYECFLWRLDDNTTSSNAAAAVDYFCDGGSFKLRPLLATNGTSGWTTLQDRSYPVPQLNIPYVITTTYDGFYVYSTVSKLGSYPSLAINSGTAVTGNITTTSGNTDHNNMNMHIAGSAHVGSPGCTPNATILMVALFDKAATDKQLKSLSENPWQLFADHPKPVYVDNTPKKLYAPALVTTRKTWTSQPLGGTRIDLSNPITSGLVLVYLPANGILGCEVMSGAPVVSSNGTLSSVVGKQGIALASSGAMPWITYPDLNGLDITGPVSCGAVFSTTQTASDAYIVSKTTSNGATNTPFSFGMTVGGKLTLNRANGSGYRVWGSVNTLISTGVTICGLVTQGGDISTSPVMYTDGKQNTSGVNNLYSGAGTGAAVGNANGVTIANRADSTTPWSGNIYMTAVWTRELSQLEGLSFTTNPWQIFQPIRQLTHVFKESV